ncbi:MAG: hypothetical protein LBU12_05065 [Deltaproteobacteria bacterium]|jgi:hypothetical protein|nr:hypothetical protein [Deltaproteobacteria bacterium]
MKTWLPTLVKELAENRSPTLSLAVRGHLGRAAVFDERGRLLAGSLGQPELEKAVSDQVMILKPREAGRLAREGTEILSERLAAEAVQFWREALDGQQKAWAAWLLTIARPTAEGLAVKRHALSANAPFTKLRLPAEEGALWSLLPLNAGLGRLLVFGDDELALETAALGARAGLKASLISVAPLDLDLQAAQLLGEFDLQTFADWSEVGPASLEQLGVKPGVMVLLTTPDSAAFLETLKSAQLGWLGLAGEAAEPRTESGLFPQALTPAQRALGLVAAMLEGR